MFCAAGRETARVRRWERSLQDPWVRGCLVAGAVMLAVTAITGLPWAAWLAWAYLVGLSVLDGPGRGVAGARRRPTR